MFPKKINWFLVAVVLMGFAWRLWGINYGLPKLLNCDEDISMFLILRMIRDNTLNPHWFAYPQGFWFYINLFVYKVYSSVLFGLQGHFNFSNIYLYNYIKTHLAQYYLISRTIQVCFSTSSIIILYKLAKYFSNNKQVGLLSALFLAIAPLPNYFTKSFARIEELAIPFVLATLYLLLKYVREKKPWSLYWAFFCSGLVVSIKWPFIWLLIICLLVYFLEYQHKKSTAFVIKKQIIHLLVPMLIIVMLISLFVSKDKTVIQPTIKNYIFTNLVPKANRYSMTIDRDVYLFPSIARVIPFNKTVDKPAKINLLINKFTELAEIFLFLIVSLGVILMIALKKGNHFAAKLANILFAPQAYFLLGIWFIGFCLFAPFCILDFPTTVYQASAQFWGDFNFIKSSFWYLWHPLREGIGGLIFAILAAGGFIYIFCQQRIKPTEKLIILLFPLIYFLYLCIPGITFYRWMLPIIPFQAFYLAYSITLIFKWLKKSNHLKILLVFFILVLSLGNIFQIIKKDMLFMNYYQRQSEYLKIWQIS